MSLKRNAELSISMIQPSPKRRRLNSSLPDKIKLNGCTDNQLLFKNKNNNPCTLSYYDYNKKFAKKSINFTDIEKDNFVRSLGKISYLYGHRGCVNTVCWEKSGRHICTGSDDETVRLWDVFGIKYNGKQPKMLCILKGHLSNVFTAKFMYNSSVFGINNIIASGGNDADLHIFDINHSPYTFKPYYDENKRLKTTRMTTPKSLFIKPFTSYYHHSRKILKIAVHPQTPFEIFSCSADGTIRHFDIRQKYKRKEFINSSSEDIIIQGFGGGPRRNRGRFNESLLYDFNTFNKHWTVYSIDINPIKYTEILTCCGDGYIRIFDLRKHQNGNYNKYSYKFGADNNINSLSKYNRNNAISSFYNFRVKYPQHFHPTHAIYNSDGSEILTTHIHDACYLYIHPSQQQQMEHNRNFIEDETEKIMKFIEEEEDINDDNNNNNKKTEEEIENIEVNTPCSSDENEENEEDVEINEDYMEFVDMLNFAVVSRMAAQQRQEIFDNAINRNENEIISEQQINDLIPRALWNETDSDDDQEEEEENDNDDNDNNDENETNTVRIGVDHDILDYVETLVNRRKEVLRTNASEHNFQDILFNLVSKQESKLMELHKLNKYKLKSKELYHDIFGDNDRIKIMKWNKKKKIKKQKKEEENDNNKLLLLPPIDSNIDIINYYHNKYYKQSYKYYIDDNDDDHDDDDENKEDLNENINGMIIGEEAELHNLHKNRYYFGRYCGHIHCETIKEVSFFGDNYIITGSDDKCIYIYNRLNGDIINILDNKTNIINNIATHPHLPIFVSSGLDSFVTIWGPTNWNKKEDEEQQDNNNNDNIHDNDNKQREMRFTQQIVDNIVRLRHRAGSDIL